MGNAITKKKTSLPKTIIVLSLMLITLGGFLKLSLSKERKLILLDNRRTMYSKIRKLLPERPVVMEVGVHTGRNAAILLEQINPRLLILSDLWAETLDARFKSSNEQLVKNRFSKEIRMGLVDVRKGDSIEQIRSVKEKSVDLVYIDTTHAFTLTLRELQNAERIVKREGFLCGHDFVQPLGRENSYGVIAAVVEFCLQRNWSITHLSMENPRSFCLRRDFKINTNIFWSISAFWKKAGMWRNSWEMIEG